MICNYFFKILFNNANNERILLFGEFSHLNGTTNRDRTGTTFQSTDFKSAASANSAIVAYVFKYCYCIYFFVLILEFWENCGLG